MVAPGLAGRWGSGRRLRAGRRAADRIATGRRYTSCGCRPGPAVPGLRCMPAHHHPGNNDHDFYVATGNSGQRESTHHAPYVVAGNTPVLVHNSSCFDPAEVSSGLPEYTGGATSGTGVSADGTVYDVTSGSKAADADLPKIVNDRLRAAGRLPGAANSARASDAEQKFAAIMIRDGIDRANLVINNPVGPCTVTLGCDDVLDTILGDRSLTVHWPDGNGGWASQTYGGAG